MSEAEFNPDKRSVILKGDGQIATPLWFPY
jgi:hypothetical protein